MAELRMGLIRTLNDSEPFKHLPASLLDELTRASQVKKYPSHCNIFNQHDRPTGYLFLVKQGLVEIVALTPGGVEMVVDQRQEGDFFGGTPVFTNEPYTAGARTVTATECYLIPAELLTRTAEQFPQLKEYFTKEILSRVRSLYAEMVSSHARKSLNQMEAYPFRKRLLDIMSTPAETCLPETPIRDVARQMSQKGVGAILVCDRQDRLEGIITERDLVSKIITRTDLKLQGSCAQEIMTRNPVTMSPDSYMFEAASYIMEHRVKHLPILRQGKVIGIVTLQDLLRFRSQKSILLTGRINKAQSFEDLAAAKAGIASVAKALLSEARSQAETLEILSHLHHAILRRGYTLALEQMRQQGQTPPDIRHCFMIMGSGGRKEMLLGPDQDHGFVFENFPDGRQKEIDDFFVPFSDLLVDAYARIGYPRCNGKVMANNPLWRGRLKEWYSRIYDWVKAPEPQRVRYSTIFFDFMPLVGDASLCQDLRNIVHQQIREFPLFLYHVMALDFKHKVPLNLLGRFSLDREHKGQLSLKQTGSIFIVDCVRMFLLEKQVHAITTSERIDELVKLKIFNQDTAEHLRAAFEAFNYLRLRNEIQRVDAGQEPSHYLDPYSLSKDEQDLLKEAFRAASKLQDSAKRHFNVG